MKFSLSLALACALATGSLRAQQQSTSANSPKERASTEKTSKKLKEAQAKADSTPVSAGEAKTSKKPKEAKAKADSPPDNEEDIDIPVPEGVPVKGIKVPSYNADGKLVMMLDAEQARKLDADRIEFENLKIDAYSDDDKKIYVELPRAIFNLTTRILTSESRVLIRREDFELVGDAGEFYTKNRFAKILGNVKMTILSTENFDSP